MCLISDKRKKQVGGEAAREGEAALFKQLGVLAVYFSAGMNPSYREILGSGA